MTDYTKIDEAIIHEIGCGRNAAWAIVDATDKLTKPLWSAYCQSGMRVVDRRLQALKKSGKISYARSTGWVIGGEK